ncbi:hypothetical protein KIL84_023123 [Mauremys mutica]|uniref:Uncharacterized protein n=1 Tax=Mauremys mutica TaxID=74926 RepID=A0A9D3WLU1_9SAUR|nr:hypothetical protein KIL84_023123 [Mauremys mutica]
MGDGCLPALYAFENSSIYLLLSRVILQKWNIISTVRTAGHMKVNYSMLPALVLQATRLGSRAPAATPAPHGSDLTSPQIFTSPKPRGLSPNPDRVYSGARPILRRGPSTQTVVPTLSVLPPPLLTFPTLPSWTSSRWGFGASEGCI